MIKILNISRNYDKILAKTLEYAKVENERQQDGKTYPIRRKRQRNAFDPRDLVLIVISKIVLKDDDLDMILQSMGPTTYEVGQAGDPDQMMGVYCTLKEYGGEETTSRAYSVKKCEQPKKNGGHLVGPTTCPEREFVFSFITALLTNGALCLNMIKRHRQKDVTGSTHCKEKYNVNIWIKY